MNPKMMPFGKSFKGSYLYYMHDKGAKTRNRVGFTHTGNMMTDDPDKAWKVMSYTAKNQDRLKQATGHSAVGSKCQKPVMTYALNWHPEQNPTQEHMMETALQSIEVLGLEEHEFYIVEHTDTPHKHVHVIVNRIHPLEGIVASDSNDFHKLSAFARRYAKKHNLNYSPQRVINHAKREKGEFVKYHDPKIAEAWEQSDSGKSFAAALEANGYHLAQGRKRFVVIDLYGKVFNPTKLLDVKAKEINDRLKDLDLSALPDATELAKSIAAQHEQKKKQSQKQVQAKFSQASQQPSQPPQSKADFKEVAGEPVEFQREPVEPLNTLEPVIEQPLSAREQATLSLQQRHAREYDKISNYYQRRIIHENRRLSAFYDFENTQKSIQQLKVKCANPSFWQKLTGAAHRNREELAIQQLNYTQAQTRYHEYISSIENQRDKAILDLKSRQEHEWTQFEHLLTKAKIDHELASGLSPQNRLTSINDFEI